MSPPVDLSVSIGSVRLQNPVLTASGTFGYGLEYDDLDIINNPDNFQEMVEKTGQPLQPCIQIDDVMLVDVSGDEVEAYLLQEKIVAPNNTEVGVATDSACTDEEHAAMRQAAATSWTTFSN